MNKLHFLICSFVLFNLNLIAQDISVYQIEKNKYGVCEKLSKKDILAFPCSELSDIEVKSKIREAINYANQKLSSPNFKLELFDKWIIQKKGLGDTEIINVINETWKKCKIQFIIPCEDLKGNKRGFAKSGLYKIVLEPSVLEENHNVLAGVIIHEYLHIIGFNHFWLTKRKSVPYRVGDLVSR